MAAEPQPVVSLGKSPNPGPGSNQILQGSVSNELFFAVVGHAGSGTSAVATALSDLLRETPIQGQRVDVEILKARSVIQSWAELRGKELPGGEKEVRKFMKRDADASQKHGQHVADAFHLADFFVDNTTLKTESKSWVFNDELSRLMKIISHSEIKRPRPDETSMYHAYGAQMQSACLSRQVGAALVDCAGNIVATGTNEVPRAGGGVYREPVAKSDLDCRCAMFPDSANGFCRNTKTQNEIIQELIDEIPELNAVPESRKGELGAELRKTQIGNLIEFSRAVHAEMSALLSAARNGMPLIGTKLYVTTFPCHYCARHIITAGVDEVQYIEPYPKSQALKLHNDAITTDPAEALILPSKGGQQVLFRPFSGVSPRLYKRAFLKQRELKDKNTGMIEIQKNPQWGTPWHLSKASYPELEAALTEEAPAR